MTWPLAYGCFVAGLGVGILVAALLRANGCPTCEHNGPIVRRAYDVHDAWAGSRSDISIADALNALSDECAHSEAAW